MGAPKLKSHVNNADTASEVEQPQLYDTNPFWQSTLFSDVYLRNDVPNKYRDIWEQDSAGSFYEFCERFRDLCDELQGETFENWSERTTINRFIKPVLKLLGWSTTQQEPWVEDESFSVSESGETKTYKPDFIIVHDPKQLKYIEKKSGYAKLEEARGSSIISIEVKYWGRIDESKYSHREDKNRADKKGQPDATRSMDFDEQCLKYVEILQHDYGILTDGRTWRLFHKELSSGSFKRCYQFNLGNLIKHIQAGLNKKGSDYLTFVENAKYFYHLFSKSALYNADGGRRFVDDLISDSRKYADQIEEDLKLRFVSAMAIACNGFRSSLGKSYSSDNLDLIRSTAESHIFTILFIRYCESRNILPIRQNPEYRMMSLSNIIDKLDLFDPEKESDNLNFPILKRRFRDQFDYTPDGTELHDTLLKIVDILQNGFQHPAAKFYIAGFKETVFSHEELLIAKKYKISNQIFVKLLFELTYIESETTSRMQQIAYSFFAPRQLGSIYESFLEFKLEVAEADLAFIDKQWREANLTSEKVRNLKIPKAKKSELFFTPDNKDRRFTGSYYTPDDIVQSIVAQTLIPLVEKSSSEAILNLTVCDPAMGSGHFLCGSLNFLAKAYLSAIDKEIMDDLSITVSDAKSKILKSCIYGVDLNMRAVKLAKMSLWLETAQSGRPLENIDDQIKFGNSLIAATDIAGSTAFDWKVKFPFLSKRRFDAIIGNPPYIFTRDQKFSEEEKGYHSQKYTWSRFKLNSAQSFVELAFSLTKYGGRIGFILPNTWLSIQTSDSFRENLLKNSNQVMVINCLDKIFKDASVDNAILIAEARPPSVLPCSLTTKILKDSKIVLMSNSHDVKPSGGVISCQPITGSSLIEKIAKRSINLGDVVPVKTGLQAYEVGKGQPKQTEEMKVARIYHHKKKVNSRCRKYLEGRDVKRFGTSWSGQYLEYGKNLAASRDPKIYESPRILIRQIPSNPPYCINAAVVFGEEVNDINSMIVVTESEDQAHLICAILNSKLISDWFIQRFDKFQRKTFPQIKVKEMAQFPYPAEIKSETKSALIKISKDFSDSFRNESDTRHLVDLNNLLEKIVFEAFQL